MSNPVMNDTKWNEVRLAMYGLDPAPAYRTVAANGYVAPKDREWYYHIRIGGYAWIQSVEIFVDTPTHRDQIRSALRKIHVPGEETSEGFRVFGHVPDGMSVDYL